MDRSRRGFLEISGASALTALTPAVRTAKGSDDPLGVRKDFPAIQDYTFINTAYIGLIPNPVVTAAHDWIDARSRHTYSVGQMEDKKHEARKLFAEMVGASEDEIGFLFSTTEGENIVVNSLDFKAGDNIVFDDLVYESTPVIYRKLQETHGVELRVVKNRKGAGTVEDFAKYVDKRTRMISVAWVSNTSGHRHDMKGLADLAHAHGSYLYADAAQFIGTAPVDVRALGIDFFTTGTYKWIMAGFGVAPFYVRRELLDRIQPANVGWMVQKRLPDYHYEHYRTARKFEYSSPSYGQFYELAAALTYLKGVGLERVEAQSLSLVQQLREGLVDQGFEIFTPEGNGSPIVSFFVKKTKKEVQTLLEAERIKVSVQEPNDSEGPVVRVRVSPAFFNNGNEVRRFLEVSAKMMIV
jgi:selenocysteine lyase/cysteine desulfurase